MVLISVHQRQSAVKKILIFSVLLLIWNFFVFCANFYCFGSVLRPLRFLCDLCGKLWLRFSSCSFVSSVVKNGFGCGSATLCPLW